MNLELPLSPLLDAIATFQQLLLALFTPLTASNVSHSLIPSPNRQSIILNEDKVNPSMLAIEWHPK